ncbi:LOW QUALITY PROTEIN: cingulin-like protein 1 [Alosa sapidissima]|uniref:LOW QUALITY PROTEIN: cingulin-like protein 1 n=1 Tax=Alosa sapidissima TaxID=34773 RepID=UPI001C08BA6C|nr:LOW QUALITY PROTEIN: cingulin-like protein 1 [Alosa sapidissima]
MESYRVGAAPGPTLQPVYPPQVPRGAKGQANGSYGLSIRVQGIDGHPYVVLNNQDRPSNPYPPSNGHHDPEGSFIDDYQEYDFRGPSPFVEFRSQNPAGAGTSGPPAMGLKENQDPQQAARRSPNLLNFQKHPELLKPYDPDSNTLEAFRSPPTRPQGAPLPDSAVPTAAHTGSSSLERPRTPTGQQVPKMPAPSQAQTYPRPYLSKSSTQGPPQSQNQAHPAVQSQVKPKAQPQTPAPAPAPVPAPAHPPQTKLTPAPRVPLPKAAPTSDPAPTAPAGSASCVQTLSQRGQQCQLQPGARLRCRFRLHWESGSCPRPDVLPLRRVDSSGPVLQSTSSFAPRSRNSSTSSTATSSSATASRTLSPGRPPSDELEALYAESINRHKNRRYIPFLPGTGRDIDTGPLPAVDALISHFDGTGTGTQRRGRSGRRGRIDPEDRKRSRSVDSALPFGLSSGGDYLEQVSRDRGRSGEHVLRPSQLGLKKGSGGCGVSPTLTLPAGRRASARDPPRGSSAPGSPQGSLPRKEASALGFGRLETRSSGLPQEEGQAEAGSKVKTSIATTSLSRPNSRTSSSPKAKGPELEAQVTPDLLKGQQNVAQQTHEETAKQILFSYLKAGSNDNDDTTKRKVNLVFEKIQTLKSRAAGSAETTVPDQAKALEEQKVELEKQVSDLKARLEEETKVHTHSSVAVARERAEVDAARGAAEGQVGRLSQEAERLRRRVQELENEVAKLNRIIDEAKLQENRLAERLGRLEKEKKLVEEALAEVREEEEEMSRANRALTTRLEDVQRNLSRLTVEHRELEERLREERSQKEQFKSTKNQIEEERRLLDRTVEKLQREMNEIVEASQSSTQELQDQIDAYKEKNRRELTELQRQLRERTAELEQSRQTAKTLQEEAIHLAEDLRECKRERDDSVQQAKELERKVFDLEVEADTRHQTKDDKTRQIKMLEERISQLEMDLDEERQSGDQLMDRIDRGREQVEQMRSELLHERSGRQDLECDKMALERQNKDLKSRVAHLEGSQKSNKEGLVSQLEARIQELEERLEGEERERANLQMANRRLERKVKEMMMQVDDEHNSLQDQKDQLNLRLKALKRQMDEAEEEIDRLEHGKKKLQRDLDEQQEANEQLQSQLKALRSEMRRKTNSAPILNTDLDDDDDDDISTDGETYFSSSSGYKRSSSQDNIISTYTL